MSGKPGHIPEFGRSAEGLVILGPSKSGKTLSFLRFMTKGLPKVIAPNGGADPALDAVLREVVPHGWTGWARTAMPEDGTR